MSQDAIQTNFESFHAVNPVVYGLFVSKTRQIKELGYTRYGSKAVWESMRWSPEFRAVMDSFDGTVAFQDKFQSRYVRLLLKQEPDLAGFFEVRPLLGERNKKQVVVSKL